MYVYDVKIVSHIVIVVLIAYLLMHNIKKRRMYVIDIKHKKEKRHICFISVVREEQKKHSL